MRPEPGWAGKESFSWSLVLPPLTSFLPTQSVLSGCSHSPLPRSSAGGLGVARMKAINEIAGGGLGWLPCSLRHSDAFLHGNQGEGSLREVSHAWPLMTQKDSVDS